MYYTYVPNTYTNIMVYLTKSSIYVGYNHTEHTYLAIRTYTT